MSLELRDDLEEEMLPHFDEPSMMSSINADSKDFADLIIVGHKIETPALNHQEFIDEILFKSGPYQPNE